MTAFVLPVSPSLLSVGEVATSAAPRSASASTPSFSDAMREVASEAFATIKAGETASIGALEGKVSFQDATSAILKAEETVRTALAVRDKLSQAFLELSRMGI